MSFSFSTRWQLALLLMAGSASSLSAQQDSVTRARLDSLEQALKVLSRIRELEHDSSAQAASLRSSVSIGGDGFQFRSPDGNWRLRITGYFQADGRFYLNDDANLGVNSLLIRRARPMVEGTVFKYFDFRFMPDFGGGQPTLYEGYLEARLSPAFSLRAGKFKPPIGLERLQSATDIRFVERGFPTNLAPNRDLGIQVAGELGHGVVQYAAGLFNGVVDLGFGDSDANDSKEVAGRLFLLPFAAQGRRAPVDLGFGIAGSVGNEHGTIAAPQTSSLRSPGQLTVFRYRTGTTAAAAVLEDGRRSRIAPQAYLYRGSLGLIGEYTVSRHTVRLDQVVQRIPHRAWQAAGSIVLTGERQSFGGVTPKRPFDPAKGKFGAVELAARYHQTEVDADAFPVFADPAASARRVRAWTVGVNWHLARRVKLMVDYERARFTGGAANGADRPTENLVITRFQTAF
jgi:phosphate-selective porin OprO/OprP